MRCAGNSDLIHQMYIYGSSLRAYLLAAVVPSKSKSHDSTLPEYPCLLLDSCQLLWRRRCIKLFRQAWVICDTSALLHSLTLLL